MPHNSDVMLAHLEQLNMELLKTLEMSLACVKNFCEKNSIPFYDEKIMGLLAKAECLLDEFESQKIAHALRLSDDWKHRDESDGKVPVPPRIYRS